MSFREKIAFKSFFYEKAIAIWDSMKIEVKCAKKEGMQNEVLYKSHFFKRTNGSVFNFPNLSNKRTYLPHNFKDLPVTLNPTKIDPRHRDTILELNKCFWRFPQGGINDKQGVSYLYSTEDGKVDITDMTFKTLYRSQISKRVVEEKWRSKWDRVLNNISIEEWTKIWNTIHNSIHGFRVQSCIWEIVHLNFYCGYRARQIYREDGKCKLCGVEESDIFHIILRCQVLLNALSFFEPILKQIKNQDISEKEICLGLFESASSIEQNL